MSELGPDIEKRNRKRDREFEDRFRLESQASSEDRKSAAEMQAKLNFFPFNS